MRNIKRTYLLKLRTGDDPDAITKLPHATLGRPLLIGECMDCCHAGSKQIVKIILSPGLKTLNVLGVNLFGFTVYSVSWMRYKLLIVIYSEQNLNI